MFEKQSFTPGTDAHLSTTEVAALWIKARKQIFVFLKNKAQGQAKRPAAPVDRSRNSDRQSIKSSYKDFIDIFLSISYRESIFIGKWFRSAFVPKTTIVLFQTEELINVVFCTRVYTYFSGLIPPSV